MYCWGSLHNCFLDRFNAGFTVGGVKQPRET